MYYRELKALKRLQSEVAFLKNLSQYTDFMGTHFEIAMQLSCLLSDHPDGYALYCSLQDFLSRLLECAYVIERNKKDNITKRAILLNSGFIGIVKVLLDGIETDAIRNQWENELSDRENQYLQQEEDARREDELREYEEKYIKDDQWYEKPDQLWYIKPDDDPK